jgi:hypothetical protein
VDDISLSMDGETLLVVYSDRFEVQTLRGDIAFARPVIWHGFPQRISRSHDGAFIAARTRTDTGVDGVTLWRVACGTEVFRPCLTDDWRALAPVFSHSGGLLAYDGYDDECAKRLIVWDILGDTGIVTFDFPQRFWTFRLRFGPDDKTVLGHEGFIRIDNESAVWTPWPEPDTPPSMITWCVIPPSMIGSRIDYSRHGWVRCDREDLMWVPPHYRPPLSGRENRAIWQGTVVLWNDDSMVVMKIVDPNH